MTFGLFIPNHTSIDYFPFYIMSSASLSTDKETKYLLGTPTKSNHNFRYGEALMHLVKGYMGTGIFSMGDAFKHSGIILGLIFICFLGVVTLHCCHLLVNTCRTLCEKHELKEVPGYAETAELCFSLGRPNLHCAAAIVRVIVNTFLIMGQLGFCACYLVFISRNIQEVMKVHNISLDIRWIILIVVVPIWVTCLIRTLKFLSPLSIIANIILLTSVLIVLYYAFSLPLNRNKARWTSRGPARFTIFFGQSIFAFEGIGLVLILYSEMKNPERFQSACGVLNVGLAIVTVNYAMFGLITYLQFGEEIKDTVTLNLKTTDSLAQVVLTLISIGVSFSFSLQLYVAIDILWPKLTMRFGPFNHPVIGELLFRSALVAGICIMSQAIPNLEILLSFVGSFISVALIIVFPAIMDLVTFYSLERTSKFVYIKDSLIIILGILGMGAGTYESLALLANN